MRFASSDEVHGQETWKGATKSTVVLKKFDTRGNLIDVPVRGNKTVHLSPEERAVNEELVADEKYNPFRNGLLTPVVMLEGNEEEAEEFASTPATRADSELLEVFDYNWKAYDKFLDETDNEILLNRLLDLAKQNDDKVTNRQLQRLEDRVAQVRGGEVTESENVGQVYEPAPQQIVE